ncbi:MAG: DNA replication/repair protein RecF [Solirubrobacteraceae bacterium]
MRVTRLRLRDFRSYASAELRLGAGITVIQGRNGAGKTNLLEGLYLACTGRSFRTASEREAIRFGATVARVELEAEAGDGAHEISVGLRAGERRHLRVDGTPVERLADVTARPLAGVFSPDRLALVKGGPALRRAHVDQVVAALRPARADTRRSYARALVQRNALLGRLRAGAAGRDALGAWDAELSIHGVALMGDRREAVEQLAPRFRATAAAIGLDGEPEVVYRPRSRSTTAAELAAELAERLGADLERGFTVHGPHRDDVALLREGRELRTYGSQGQQRLGLLALMLAEREAIALTRGTAPLMLLDDAMSELDLERRSAVVDALGGAGGQSVLTTTDLDAIPGARDPGVARATVSGGAVLEATEDWAAA